MKRAKKTKRVVIAVGGTGGHLFPAQGFAQEALEEWDVEVLFAGKGLKTNSYLDRERFIHHEIDSMTPFRGSKRKALMGLYRLIKGVCQSVVLFSKTKPSLVVGFGSFHSFPLLIAARLHRIPLVLFESNAMPGKVVRLFSKKAAVTGIYLKGAAEHLKGQVEEVAIPLGRRLSSSFLSRDVARKELGLEPGMRTLLCFGGSQGAKAMNETVLKSLPLLKAKGIEFQLIHLTGSKEMQESVEKICSEHNISCYVKSFEKRMDLVMAAADVAFCRAGAMTVAELLHHELPSILVPYPFASDDHQRKNALFLQDEAKGAVCVLEKELDAQKMVDLLQEFLALSGAKLHKMRQSLENFNRKQKKTRLVTLIEERLWKKSIT